MVHSVHSRTGAVGGLNGTQIEENTSSKVLESLSLLGHGVFGHTDTQMHTHTHTHTHIHSHTHTETHKQTHTEIHTHTLTHTRIHTLTLTHTNTHRDTPCTHTHARTNVTSVHTTSISILQAAPL